MALRVAYTGTALLLALSVLMMVVQSSSAQEEQVSVAQANSSQPDAPQNGVSSQETDVRMGQAVIGRVGFNCIVPRIGTGQCGRQFRVPNGASLRVWLNTSGGKRVDFRAYDVGTGQGYGVKPVLRPGQRPQFMWKNRTRSAQWVYVRAGTPGQQLVRVQAVGHYTIYR